MKTVKRIAAVLLAVMLMAPAAVNAAAPSVRDTNLNKKKATATVTYNKKTQLPTTITVNGQKLVVGKDCVIVKKKKSGKKNAGTYKITIKGIGNYSGTLKKQSRRLRHLQKLKLTRLLLLRRKVRSLILKQKLLAKK